MSTALAGAECVRVDGRVAWIRVGCEADGGLSYDFSDVYALTLVFEPFQIEPVRAPGVPWPTPVEGALYDALERALRAARPGASELDELVDDLCSGGTHFPAAPTFAARFMRAVGYRDLVGPSLPAGLVPDSDGLVRPGRWWRDDAERLRERDRLDRAYFDLLERQRTARTWPPLVSATLVVEATETPWLEHLEVGMRWDSYCYDSEGDTLP